MIDIKKVLGDTTLFLCSEWFVLTNNPFLGGFFNRGKETQKIKGARKLEVSLCFALVLEKAERKGKAILNTTGLFYPKTMQYFTGYHDFCLRVLNLDVQNYTHFVELRAFL